MLEQLQNNGYLKWPEGKSMLKCKKDKSTIFCDNYNLPSIDMNEETDIVLNFNKCSKIIKGNNVDIHLERLSQYPSEEGLYNKHTLLLY